MCVSEEYIVSRAQIIAATVFGQKGNFIPRTVRSDPWPLFRLCSLFSINNPLFWLTIANLVELDEAQKSDAKANRYARPLDLGVF